MKKIKIAYFIDSWEPGAGTENQLRGVLHHLDPERFEARLFTLRHEIDPEHRKEIPWPVECLQVSKLRTFSALVAFFKLVARLRKEEYDLVITYFYDANLFVIPASYLAGTGTRIVNRRNMGYAVGPRLLRFLKAVNRITDHFLVNSEAIRNRTIEVERVPADRISVIYNGTWNRSSEAAPEISRADLGIAENVPIVGITANLRPVKRIDRFIAMAARVAKEFPDACFLVLGQGELEPELRQQATLLHLGNRLRFLGSVLDVRPYLALFSVGVLTSESEGLSNSLIEYAQSGVPAVAFDVGGNREIIASQSSGYIVLDGDIGGLAEAVTIVLRDDNLRAGLSAAARERAVALFEPESIMRKTVSFYEEMAQSHR